MELITVDKEMCRRDGICMESCPARSITADAEGYPMAAEDAVCFECGHCVAICPHGALEHNRLPMDGFIPLQRQRAGFAELSALMKARRSVREFKDKPVPQETIAQLLETARFAPTARNTQQVGYIVLSDPDRLKTLAAGVVDWLRAVPGAERYVQLWDSGHDVALRGAPHALVALGDAASDWAEVDASIALTFVELAAASLGLGACWAGLLHRALQHSPGLAASIGVPEGRSIGGALMLGVPKYKYSLVPPRKAVDVSWM